MGNHAQLRGGSVAERLMSTMAYGWVERCSDVVGCGPTYFKTSILVYFVPIIVFAYELLWTWRILEEILLFLLYINEYVYNLMNACMDDCFCYIIVCFILLYMWLIQCMSMSLCSWGYFSRLTVSVMVASSPSSVWGAGTCKTPIGAVPIRGILRSKMGLPKIIQIPCHHVFANQNDLKL